MNETLNVIELKEMHLNLKRRVDKIYNVDLNSSSLTITTNNENLKSNLQYEQLLSSKTQKYTGKIYLMLLKENLQQIS